MISPWEGQSGTKRLCGGRAIQANGEGGERVVFQAEKIEWEEELCKHRRWMGKALSKPTWNMWVTVSSSAWLTEGTRKGKRSIH